MSCLKLNNHTLPLVQQLLTKSSNYRVKVTTLENGSIVIDAGVQAKGGILAGKLITEICLGGYGAIRFGTQQYDNINLPTILVSTDYPAIATLGSQLAGWRIHINKYFAIASGPARALALKPKDIYKKINYVDTSNTAIIFLETSQPPTRQVTDYIAHECNITSNQLYVIFCPTTCIVGSIQISGRVVETAIHKLLDLGFDTNTILTGIGVAPIAPVHSKFTKAMGRTNDMILYGGIVHLFIDSKDEHEIQNVIEKTPSLASPQYGKPFTQVFEEAGKDFYQIDKALFAPAVVVINNIRTGHVFQAGQINSNIIARSIHN